MIITEKDNYSNSFCVNGLGVHAILEYEDDSKISGTNGADGMMEKFISEFSSCYK